MHDDPGQPHRPSRRAFLIGGAALALSSCGPAEDESYMASATRGSRRVSFPDSVAWVDPGSYATTVAFVPFRLSDRERQSVIAGRGVYPALSSRDPMMEIRFELGQGDEPGRLRKEYLDSLQMTFWHFDEPAPVILDKGEALGTESDLSILGLDGEARHGGWAVGTIRGQRVVTNMSGNSEAYTWNLTFQLSIA